MNDLPPLLRIEDLAEALGLKLHGARAILRRREIPASKVGRIWIVRRDALLQHLVRMEKARRAPAPSEVRAARLLASLPAPRRGRHDLNTQTEGGNDATQV